MIDNRFWTDLLFIVSRSYSTAFSKTTRKTNGLKPISIFRMSLVHYVHWRNCDNG